MRHHEADYARRRRQAKEAQAEELRVLFALLDQTPKVYPGPGPKFLVRK